jgi:hypothetical protein
MSPRIARWFLIAALPLAIAATPADAPRRTDQLLRKSGLWSQLGDMQEQVRNGALEGRAKEEARGAPPLEEEGFKKLTGAIERAFAPDRLREIVAQELAQALPAEDEAAVLSWLDSDAGKRFARLEEDSLKPEQVETMQREARDALAGASKERLTLVTRFGDAVGAGEIDATIVVNLVSAVGYGVALTTPLPPVDVKVFKQRMEKDRPRMAAAYKWQALGRYAWLYRAVPDAEFARYVEFAESAAGKRYYAAAVKALDLGLTRAAFDMGLALGGFTRETPKLKT